jgi:transposase-like protein
VDVLALQKLHIASDGVGMRSMSGKSHGKSRRQTPWDTEDELTPTQRFLRAHYQERYVARHPKLNETGEAELINTFEPIYCPYSRSEEFIKRGFTSNGVQRYSCACGRRFLPTTNTIFDNHKIAISEWMEYCLNLFRYVSINADSWNNKNAFSTSRYWLEKLFLTLVDYQQSIVLSGMVWLDETYYSVINAQIDRKEDGTKYRGLSHNQIRIGAATDKENVICFVEGTGKPSQRSTFETFSQHIATGSTLVHDKEAAHKKLIISLGLINQEYLADDLKVLKDSENPMNPINKVHDSLKKFLNAHSGFNRDSLQGYLNLFAFVWNPPHEPLEKVAKIFNLVFENPKSLRYREQFGANIGF